MKFYESGNDISLKIR